MPSISVARTDLNVSDIALGCMRMASLSIPDLARLLAAALDLGINFFDHADIYGGGQSEAKFAEAARLAGLARPRLILQSKCGIRSGYYDFSTEHLVAAVEGSLQRLGTDYLDVLLLHRPDALVEPEEVAEAFTRLETSGKVRWFGVSNHNSLQIELLSRTVTQPLVFNQLQFGLAHTGLIDAGVHVNMRGEAAQDHDGSVLDYCRLHHMTIQPWSPFQSGFFEGVFFTQDKYAELNRQVNALAADRGVAPAAIATAWILRHPARMQPIVGTTDPDRLRDIARATEVHLTRAEWYALYRAAGNTVP